MTVPQTAAPERDRMAYYLARVDQRPRWFHLDRRIGGLLGDRRGSVSLVVATSLALAVVLGWKTIRPHPRPAVPAAALPFVAQDRPPITIEPPAETTSASSGTLSSPIPSPPAVPRPKATMPDAPKRQPAQTIERTVSPPKPRPVATPKVDANKLAILHAQGPVVPLHGEALRLALIADRNITRDANIARIADTPAPQQPAER